MPLDIGGMLVSQSKPKLTKWVRVMEGSTIRAAKRKGIPVIILHNDGRREVT